MAVANFGGTQVLLVGLVDLNTTGMWVAQKTGNTGLWSRFALVPSGGAPTAGEVRATYDYTDSVTKQHLAFAGGATAYAVPGVQLNNLGIFSAPFDANSQTVAWTTTPEAGSNWTCPIVNYECRVQGFAQCGTPAEAYPFDSGPAICSV
jgi:hypothetical protein